MVDPLENDALDSPPPDDNTIPPEFDPADGPGVLEPPVRLGGILRQLGPGLIIAGGIVGSGELIATTKTGAQAGIALLWLIIIGCLIKVFVQIELGRFAITHGETTLAALNTLPGRMGPVNWILWFWLVMMAAAIAQLGGIVGGVGQALALSFPIRGDYVRAIQMPSAKQLDHYLQWDDQFLSEYDWFLEQKEKTARVQDPWVAEKAAQTRALLDALPPDQRIALESAMREIFPVDDSSAEKGEGGANLRLTARELLMELNAAALERLITQGHDQALGLEKMSPEQRHRLLNGHLLLAEQLVDLEHNTRSSAEDSFSVVIQVLKRQDDVRTLRQQLDQFTAKEAPDPHHERLLQEFEHAKQKVSAITDPETWDDRYWAAFAALVTVVLLYNGRYGLIQTFATVLVVLFTFVTIGNVLSLQATEQWRIPWDQWLHGLSFHLPESLGGKNPLATALATFGIIGVGATELIAYPYWCIEKGYARYTGRRSDDEGWAVRARGWMKVMHWDAFMSMLIYTLATVAFFVMGVAVLYRAGLDPENMRMVSTLAESYVPVFGAYAKWLFLLGAIAVLYSTFLVALAGQTRIYTDALKIFGLMDKHDQKKHDRAISIFGVSLPWICLALYWIGLDPVGAVLLSGLMQAIMLPMLGFAAIYFRVYAIDPRLVPPRWWDVMLFLSCAGLLVAGAYGVYTKLWG